MKRIFMAEYPLASVEAFMTSSRFPSNRRPEWSRKQDLNAVRTPTDKRLSASTAARYMLGCFDWWKAFI